MTTTDTTALLSRWFNPMPQPKPAPADPGQSPA